MQLRVTEILKESPEAVSIRFRNSSIFRKLRYLPGQFLTLHVPIGGQIYTRAYSFSSNPYTDRDLQITVKRVAHGVVSNYLNGHLKTGDRLKVDSPTGSFVVVPGKKEKRQFVFFAGGSGITPVFSILVSLLEKEPQTRLLLIYANQRYDSIIFRNELTALQNRFPQRLAVEHILDTDARDEPNFHTGLISESLVEGILDKHRISYGDPIYMICGPFGYMERVKGMLLEWKVPSEQIKIEIFKSPPVRISGKELISNVELHLNGRRFSIQVAGDKSILQAAMKQNILLPYSCRSGMCATCMATCISGAVKMTDGHLLPPSEESKGKILTCVSYPVSEQIVIAF
jgi:ring-1,2-phenylacetyl-CoA epoxidase subunit PaaE